MKPKDSLDIDHPRNEGRLANQFFLIGLFNKFVKNLHQGKLIYRKLIYRKAHLSMSLGHLGGRDLLLHISVQMEIIDFLQARIQQKL